MLAESHCLISGGAGLIGRALALELSGRGRRVTVLDDLSGHSSFPKLPDGVECVRADVRDGAALEALCRRLRPDTLFHLAAIVGVRRVLRDPVEAYESSLAGTRACLRAQRALAGRMRIVFASSSEVYAEQPGPLDEQATVRTQTGGRWAYAAAKLACERLVLAADPDSRVLRFFNVVGPGQSAEAGMVLPRFVERARAGLDLELYGSGAARRTYAHVDEVARVLGELEQHPHWNTPILNVGGSARASARELAECVLRLSASKAGLRQVDPRQELGGSFEEVGSREPALARLAELGIELPSRSLEAIVGDMLERHPHKEHMPCASRA